MRKETSTPPVFARRNDEAIYVGHGKGIGPRRSHRIAQIAARGIEKIAAVAELPRNDGWFYADALQDRHGPSDSSHREEARRGDLPL